MPLLSVMGDGLRRGEGNLTKSWHLSMDMALSPKLDFFRLGISLIFIAFFVHLEVPKSDFVRGLKCLFFSFISQA